MKKGPVSAKPGLFDSRQNTCRLRIRGSVILHSPLAREKSRR
jgi:hypothetical protein